MSAQRFTLGKMVEWFGETYEIIRILPESQINLEHIPTGAIKTASLETLTRDLFDGFLSFVVEGKHGKPRTGKPAIEAKYIDLDDCPPHQVAIARFRLDAITPLLGLKPRTRQDVVRRAEEVNLVLVKGDGPVKHVSASSIYRWIADYETSGSDLRSLLPATDARGGKAQWRIKPEQNIIIDATINDLYLSREKKTVVDVQHEVARRVDQENKVRPTADKLTYPSRPTIVRRINRLDMKSVFAARHGKRAAENEFSQRFSAPEEARQILDVAEIDHTPLDLIVVDERDNLPLGRSTLTDLMDVCSRYPLGYYLGFEPPNYYAVMECLYHAIRPKKDVRQIYGTENDWRACGLMSVLVTDNGKEFIGNSLTDSCGLLNIQIQRMPVKKPHYKGKIERHLRSQTFTIHGLPGTTFSNVQQRGDYDSAGQACLYLNEAEAILNIFLVDICAQSLHKGINDIPARRWEQAIQSGFIPNVPPNAQELLILLGQVDHRTVQHYGIDFESLRYNCGELGELRVRLKRAEIPKVKIKFHPGDLAQIHVHDPFDNRYISVPILDKYRDYAQGVSLWKHRVVRSFILSQQEEVDLAALGRAKRRIQDLVDDAQRRKRSTRRREARWQNGGNPPSKAEPFSSLPGQPMPGLPAQEERPALPPPGSALISIPAPVQQTPSIPISQEPDWPIIQNPKRS